ncbi:MAG: 3-methyl-2-oxobutanoate hydroxymethyltransferase [Candidatus Omnitrophica bacterium]|nr:3-methyl-2-oxobutanoate hydroxymethyltransferase [Candidatus Omnitrophota bacterium]
MNRQTFIKAKRDGERWTMLTAYEAMTAELLEACGVDFILVGDSVGTVLLGYPSVTEVTMDEMIHHAKAARRGAKKAWVVGDLPYKGRNKGPRHALESAKRFVEEAGCDAVKVEWGKDTPLITDLLVKHRIPVMGHTGLTPQTAKEQGGLKVQGRDAASAVRIFREARFFEERGVFSVLLECVPVPVAKAITGTLVVPTIGIGAGPHCDGQVLVFQDLAGLFKKFTPRFVKRYVDLEPLVKRAVQGYVRDVKAGRFPEPKHGFSMEKEEEARFHRWASKR